MPKRTKGFQIGNTPWNKGLSGIMPAPWNKGKKCPQLSRAAKKRYTEGDMFGFKTGNTIRRGTKASQETKEKMSKSHKQYFINNPEAKEALVDFSRPFHFKKGHKKGMTGKHHSKETKKRIGEGNKGKKVSKESRKKMSKWQMGRKLSEETKKKISKALKGRKFSKEHLRKISGENAYSWLGGKSFEPYGIEFNKKLREQIRKRDNYTCQECGHTQDKLGYALPIHHIDYCKQNNNPNNLISLCRNCHSQTNFNREDWTNYFKQKVGQE